MSRSCIRVDVDPRGRRSRVRLDSSGPDGRGHLSARILGFGHASARVALVAEGALLLADDLIEVDVSVGPGAALDVFEPSGTVAYDMRGGSARWSVHIHLAEHAQLRWHGKPFVVADGADVDREVRIDLAAGATAMLRETLVLGRSGERGGTLAQRTRVSHEGQPLLVEDLMLGAHRPGTGRLGPWRVVDTASVLGRRADGIPEVVGEGAHRFELDGPGTLIRSLSGQAHARCLDPVWRVVSDTGRAPGTYPAADPVHPEPRFRAGREP
jgi:urease accessory protein